MMIRDCRKASIHFLYDEIELAYRFHGTALRIEWCRVRAQAFHWAEELLLDAKGSGDIPIPEKLVGTSKWTAHRAVTRDYGRAFGLRLQTGVSATSPLLIILLAMVDFL